MKCSKLRNVSLILALFGALTKPLLGATEDAEKATQVAPKGSTKKAETKIEGPSTQAIMHGIFAPLSVVLPLSFRGGDFEDAKNRKLIEQQLATLEKNAGKLGGHATTKSRGFEFIAKSLESDARNLHRWYAKGSYEEARFVLHHMTENCIACHSSLAETHKFPGADQFLGKIDQTKLSPLERARLQIVARQFDDAMSSYEEAFTDKKLAPMNVVSLGSFADYLKIALQVKLDPKRPQALIAKLIERADTPLHVRLQLETWMAALKALEKSNVLEQGGLDEARKLMAEGRGVMQFPRDRDGLVHYTAAGALLTRFVNTHPDRGRDVGEAYYLLGIGDSLLEHSFWITRMEFDFETAIRLAPGADFAPKAYAQLEQSLISGYTGSSGTHVPPDVASRLRELQELIREARGKTAKQG